MRPARASRLLDYEVTTDDAAGVFDRLRMVHRAVEASIEVEVPGYRVDIDREVDLIEEIARIQGYDRIGSSIPSSGQAGGVPAAYAFRMRVCEALVRAGLREARLSSFASSEDLALTGDTDAIVVANPLQAEEGYLRTRLTPGLLHAAARNQARGPEAVALFETGTVFRAGDPVQERTKVGFVLSGPAAEGWSFEDRPFDVLDAKGVLEAFLVELGVRDWALGEPLAGPFHPGRSAAVLVEGAQVGVLGELLPRVGTGLELEGRVAVVELEVSALMEASGEAFAFREGPRFPPVRRDLAFVVPEDVALGSVQAAIEEAAGGLLASCRLFDVFRGGTLPGATKSLAFALDLRAEDRTLTREESEPVVEAIVARLREDFGAELRSG